MKQSDKLRVIFAETVVRAWKDEGYRNELIKAPMTVLEAAGMQVPEGKKIVVLVNTPTLLHAILPPMSDQALQQAKIDEASKHISSLPEGAELRIVRETDCTLFFVLPANPPPLSVDSLSNDQLELAAGGKTATATHQTVVQTTTAVTTAEVATQVAEVQTVATTTTVAAEVEAVVVPCFIS